jgi:hypothetical protein
MKKNRTYTRNNPCYKSKIQYHMNKVNNLVNCAPANLDPQLLLRHMESLNHFVKQQANVQITNQHRWESAHKLQS